MSTNASLRRSFSARSSITSSSESAMRITPTCCRGLDSHIVWTPCDARPSACPPTMIVRWVIVAALVIVTGLAGCSSNEPEPSSPVDAYCAVVADTAAAMAGTDPATKRPAMARRRDAAPAEIRGDWDVVFAIEVGDPTERALAQGRVDAFDAAHC
jgi:outer membrane murein-binding lipoprotein Lpp